MTIKKSTSFKFSSKTSLVIMALSILIIAESIWLVDRLAQIKIIQEVAPIIQVPFRNAAKTFSPKASLSLLGPEQVEAGEEFSVSVLLASKADFSADGVDLVLLYDADRLQVIDQDAKEEGVQVEVAKEIPFRTVGRNFVDSETNRILLTLLDLESQGGTAFISGKELPLATVYFKAIGTGQTKVTISTEGEKGQSKIAVAGTGDPLPLSKEDLELTILQE